MMENPNTLNSGMCRCCSSEGTFKDIKTKYHWMGEEEVYADMLTDCFDIKIQTPENMDNGICEVCITQLRNAANFKKQVLHTEEQFKKRLQNKDMKNPIKLESMEDSAGSDHLSDPDFSGNEYDIPIKEEVEEKPKAKKRSVKATTSRTKKPKNEPESSELRIPGGTKIITIGDLKKARKSDSSAKPRPPRKLAVLEQARKNQYNLAQILLNSNASPIRAYDPLGYLCALCNDQYLEPRALKKHFLQDHNNDKLIKRIARNLVNHHVVKLDITFLNCALCDTDFPALESFMIHLTTTHQKELDLDVKSQIVPFRFDTPELRCALCSAEYSSFKLLQQHMNCHFSNYVCEICNAGFVAERLLTNHARTHGDGRYECKECKKTFINEHKLREHTKRTHQGFDKRNKCKFCDERFSDYWRKINHMVTEHGVQRPVLKCQACERTFDNQRSLTEHKKKDHLLERRHECPDCDMVFFRKSSMVKHFAKHTGVKKFICGVCSKAYARKHTLTEHMRIHLDDRRFSCVHCGQAFIQKCSLKGHLRSKHGEV